MYHHIGGHSKYVESQHVVQELCWQFVEQAKYLMPPEMWLSRLLNGLSSLLSFGLLRGKDLKRVLTKWCHPSLEPDVA